MIELGPGLAAVLGSVAGGGASFAATWIEARTRRTAENEARRYEEEQRIADARDAANADLVSASESLVAAASTFRRNDHGLESIQVAHARLADAAARAAIAGPSMKTALDVLSAADQVMSYVRDAHADPMTDNLDHIGASCNSLHSSATAHLRECVQPEAPPSQ